MGHETASALHPVIPLDLDVGPLVGDHRVVLESLAWFPDLLDDADDRYYLALSYRFVPPLADEEQFSRDFPWKVWELTVEDDLGTVYDANTGGVGPRGGDREIHPAPPELARVLTLKIGTPRMSRDGEVTASSVVKRFQIDLVGPSRSVQDITEDGDSRERAR
jgi:hypothetical protein